MRKKIYFFLLFLGLNWADWHLLKSIYGLKTNKLVGLKIHQYKKQVKSISTKVITQYSSGSGIILSKKYDSYLVLTNRHVIDRSNDYQIRTSDDKVHQATLICTAIDNDLALLEFKSDLIYQFAEIDTSRLRVKEQLIAAGFPATKKQIKITLGQLLLNLGKPLKYGYQIGYSNQIDLGMSGGAIINSKGRVVGINGRSANPIIPDYQFKDGSFPSDQLQEQMTELSWGIPINEAISLSSQSQCMFKNS